MTRIHTILRRFATLLAVAGLLSACASAPRKALADAEAALTDAYSASECAPEEYAAARKMLDQANAKSKAGEFDQARELAVAARDLARKAAQVARDNYERCKKRDQVLVEDEPVEDVVDEAPQQAVVDEGLSLETVYFEFNAAQLAPATQDTLRKNADWILQNGGQRVTVAGHCDARGSTEYNLALGETRAGAVKKYLVTLGVPPERLAVISYGEEVPAEDAATEAAFRLNRRAEFRAH